MPISCYPLKGACREKELIVKPGIMQPPLQFSFVLGALGGIAPTPKNLLAMREELLDSCTWQAIGIGRNQIPLGTVAMVMGGNLRVGFGDNVFLRRGVLARSNTELVEKAVRIAHELGLEVATPAEAREILRIKS